MKTKHKHRRLPAGPSAYTLVEVMIVTAIVGMVITGALAVFTQSHLALFVSVEKLAINKDMRQFTGEMAQFARNANHFYIYESFQTADRNDAADRKTRGNSGDFLVLISQKPHPDQDSPVMITGLTGFYRAAASGNRGPVRKFEIAYAEADYKDAATTQVETLLPSVSTMNSNEVVMELTEGLANGDLFLNYEDRSIMVKGKIYHGNEYKRLTDTYNFTVTPRG